MTKDEKIQIACSTIQSAIILDLFANVTDDTKKLITKQLSDIYELGHSDGFRDGLEPTSSAMSKLMNGISEITKGSNGK